VRSKIWILAASVAAAMGCGTAHATCPNPFTVKDSTGTTQNVAGINDATNNCVFPNAITDGSGAANRAAVKAGSVSPATADPALVVSVSPNSLGCAGASIANTVSTPINVTTSTQIVSGAVGKQTYLCSINLIAGAPDNVALVEGSGTICGTGTAGIAGGTTAATGWNFAANGGLTLGNGVGMVARTATAADNVCLFVGSGAQVSGSIVWAQF
jgi:hypothetical protein